MKISVYITSYNQKIYLKEAIDSVLNQTFKPFEIIVVDDFSTDGTREMLATLSKEYSIIKCYFHDQNRGVAETRITALKNVTGDYVTYVDGDDILLPRKLEIESKLMMRKEADLVFSNNVYVSENNIDDLKWVWINNDLDINENSNFFVKTLGRDFPRRSLFRMELISFNRLKEIGFHDTKLTIYEDFDLRVRLSKVCKIAFSDEVTAKIRISSNGLSKLPAEVHYKALAYIVKKYRADIKALEPKTRQILENNIRLYLPSYSSDDSQIMNAILLKIPCVYKAINYFRKTF